MTDNPPIKLLQSGADVTALAWALRAQPGVWDRNPARTKPPASPHHGLHDVWARYCAPGQDARQPHDAVWYPEADLLPVRGLVMPLMAMVGGVKLGGVLITRIPPGATCKPHTDPGWHAQHYEKFAVQIESAPGQEFCFDDTRLETKPGDVFWFDNSRTHWVTNPTRWDRVTLIACIRT